MTISTAVVIDNGSGWCKCGMAGDSGPGEVFAAVTGVPKRKSLMYAHQKILSYVGDEAMRRRSVLELKRPMERGIVTDWDGMEKVWHHALTARLKLVETADHPLFITEGMKNPSAQREKMAEIMFESHRVPSLCVANQAVCSLLATGRTTGVAIHSGDGVTEIVPMLEGRSLPHAVCTSDLVSGLDITSYLTELLRDTQQGCGRFPLFSSSVPETVVRDIKHALCYVSEDYSQEELRATSSSTTSDLIHEYELPDGQTISVGAERFKGPEVLFKPELIHDHDMIGVHHAAMASITKCAPEIQDSLLANMQLSGGTGMLPGFAHRLEREMGALANKQVRVARASAEGGSMAWVGAAALASQNSGASWISRREFDDMGPSVIHKRRIR